MIKFNCQHCGAKVKAPSTYIGKEAKCPSCKEKNIIPGKKES
jgi:DNA-directed RNA polymerase subunit RPC12/RpoP